VWRDTLLYDHIRPKLKPHGRGSVDFQVIRATHASIGHRLGLDPKVTADQRRHGVGVSIEEYTKTSLKDPRGLGAEHYRSVPLTEERSYRAAMTRSNCVGAVRSFGGCNGVDDDKGCCQEVGSVGELGL
jgi:hypothetical protein